jgi:hypothetical protein
LIQAFGQPDMVGTGFNMTNDDFMPFAIAGIRFQYWLTSGKAIKKNTISSDCIPEILNSRSRILNKIIQQRRFTKWKKIKQH